MAPRATQQVADAAEGPQGRCTLRPCGRGVPRQVSGLQAASGNEEEGTAGHCLDPAEGQKGPQPLVRRVAGQMAPQALGHSEAIIAAFTLIVIFLSAPGTTRLRGHNGGCRSHGRSQGG